MKHKFFSRSMVLLLLCGMTFSIPAQARALTQQEIERYQNGPSGGYTGWKTVNGKKRYYESGKLQKNRVTPDNVYVDGNGDPVTGSGIDAEDMAKRSKNCRVIVVKKSTHFLELWENGKKKQSYVITSSEKKGDKEISGDMKTPEGEFYVCVKNPKSKYHLALGISYPEKEDAERGLKNGIITQEIYDQILAALEAGKQPNWYTGLGGAIEIHGNRQDTDMTRGCIGMRDTDLDILYNSVEVGDKILILA